ALQRCALRGARGQSAAKQDKYCDKKSQRTAHLLTNTARSSLFKALARLPFQKIPEMWTGCLAAIRIEPYDRFTSR
ncbi:MAG TPA: hypothetical protein VIJ35_13225, partial [Bradyrhizobium sp.]